MGLMGDHEWKAHGTRSLIPRPSQFSRAFWMKLGPAGQTAVTQSLLAERILKAARDGERDPDRLRTHAITDGNKGAM
jgi:hypothetical protein